MPSDNVKYLSGVQLIAFSRNTFGISPFLRVKDEVRGILMKNVLSPKNSPNYTVCIVQQGSFHSDELPAEQVAVLRKAFEAFDSQKSGSIPCDMVADILRIMGQPFDKKILEELIEEVDADKSGRLEFEEFVTLAAKFIVEEDDEAMQKELKEAFRLYDKEGNGYIPTSCLREILRELDDQLTDGELDMMIEEIDTDGSGTVDFDEFMEMMTGEV
ncbi:troponin C-like isoform X1 [Sitophilus oryzae]|uniref:Troponin C-like isoform X1 n=1 Tax=Sitophilus oryzae TaxID=7048 RepID=A0A6J2Y8E2_SITOR|nr:troponin C-like isoform X1 [Sitophilus oryzae]